MLVSEPLGDEVRIRHGSHRSETVILHLIHLGLFAAVLGGRFRSGQLFGVPIDGILLLSSDAHEASNADRGSVLAELASLQVPNEDLLKFTYGIVVVLDEVGEVSDLTANMDRGGGIGDLKTGK